VTVVDASVVISALTDSGDEGRWAEQAVFSGPLAAPQLLHVECASVLRRAAASGQLSDDVATLAHVDLVDLRIELFAYELSAERIWELRHNVSPYDAWYVALAEALDAPLATLDQRLLTAPGPRCEFLTPT